MTEEEGVPRRKDPVTRERMKRRPQKMSRVKDIVQPITIWYNTLTHKKLTLQKLVVNNRPTHGRQDVFIKNRNFCWQKLEVGP